MGLFGFKKKKEAQNTGKPKLEYIEPTWTDEAVNGSPLDVHRTHLTMPALRYHISLPAMECYNHKYGEMRMHKVADPDCEEAKKYPGIFFLNALPITGFEKSFYPFSDETLQVVEDIIRKLEEINNIEKIRAYMAEHSDDEVVMATGEWFLGDYKNCETDDDTNPNNTIYRAKMKAREIRLYGEKQVL